MRKYLGHDYKDLVQWSHVSGKYVTSVSRTLANQYMTSVLSEADRSPFIEDEWLQEAHTRCSRTIKSIREAHSFATTASVEKDRQLDDTAFVRDVVERILHHPIHPFPPLPLDILLEIMQWSALLHREPLKLTLVSSQVQRCVDPILFSTRVFGGAYSYQGDFIINRRSFTSKFLSPRAQNYRTYVKNVTLNGSVSHVGLNNLGSVFPNVRRLIIRYLQVSSELILARPVPLLALLHCNVIVGQAPHFASPLFIGLTTLSLCLDGSPNWNQWNWATLLHMTNLSYLWISELASDMSEVHGLLHALRSSIIPSLPAQTRFCALRLNGSSWDATRDDYFPEEWNEELHHFADGSWSSRAVLMLAREPQQWIPHVVIFDPKVEEFWDKYQDEALAVVISRQDIDQMSVHGVV
ncbi:hypothetical protein DL96DRAFT_1628323 [Flagelloscypha sp. PMI_526]|nr:hypothetical protein DL96DRAFT_1628323 [Flagelloscypha sp. PMI_526]